MKKKLHEIAIIFSILIQKKINLKELRINYHHWIYDSECPLYPVENYVFVCLFVYLFVAIKI